MASWDDVRRIALALPETSERQSHGRSRDFADLCGLELLAFSGADEQHSFRGHPGHVVQQGQLERLPSDLA